MEKESYVSQFRASLEFSNRNFLFFINTSLIISYIAGALAIQIPFIDIFGIISYDYKAYLLVGVIIFIFVQIGVFISYLFEVFLLAMSEKIVSSLCNSLNISIHSRFVIILVQLLIFSLIYCWYVPTISSYTIEAFDSKYRTVLQIFYTFFWLYLFLRLILNQCLYKSHMNANKLLIILVSLMVTINAHKSNVEQYLLTDAVLSNGTSEQQIEVLYLDNDNLYYKNNEGYKYMLLPRGTSIKFSDN